VSAMEGRGNEYVGFVLYCNMIVFTFTIGTKNINVKTVTLQILLLFVSTLFGPRVGWSRNYETRKYSKSLLIAFVIM
jgi:hypothetical protein